MIYRSLVCVFAFVSALGCGFGECAMRHSSHLESHHTKPEQHLEPAVPVAYGYSLSDSHAYPPTAVGACRCPVARADPTLTFLALLC